MNENGTVASDYAIAGIMLYFHGIASEPLIHTETVERLADYLSSNLGDGFTPERTRKFVTAMTKMGVGTFYDDPFADPIFRVTDNEIYDFFSKRTSVGDIYSRAWNLDLDWLKTAFRKSEFWEQVDLETDEIIQTLIPIEAGVLDLDSNSEAFKDASELVDELLSKLDNSNDVGELSPEDVVFAKSELSEIAADLKGGQVVAPDFYTKSRSVLVWIVKQAAGAVVGALALSLLAAIFSIPLVPF